MLEVIQLSLFLGNSSSNSFNSYSSEINQSTYEKALFNAANHYYGNRGRGGPGRGLRGAFPRGRGNRGAGASGNFGGGSGKPSFNQTVSSFGVFSSYFCVTRFAGVVMHCVGNGFIALYSTKKHVHCIDQIVRMRTVMPLAFKCALFTFQLREFNANSTSTGDPQEGCFFKLVVSKSEVCWYVPEKKISFVYDLTVQNWYVLLCKRWPSMNTSN